MTDQIRADVVDAYVNLVVEADLTQLHHIPTMTAAEWQAAEDTIAAIFQQREKDGRSQPVNATPSGFVGLDSSLSRASAGVSQPRV